MLPPFKDGLHGSKAPGAGAGAEARGAGAGAEARGAGAEARGAAASCWSRRARSASRDVSPAAPPPSRRASAASRDVSGAPARGKPQATHCRAAATLRSVHAAQLHAAAGGGRGGAASSSESDRVRSMGSPAPARRSRDDARSGLLLRC